MGEIHEFAFRRVMQSDFAHGNAVYNLNRIHLCKDRTNTLGPGRDFPWSTGLPIGTIVCGTARNAPMGLKCRRNCRGSSNKIHNCNMGNQRGVPWPILLGIVHRFNIDMTGQTGTCRSLVVLLWKAAACCRICHSPAAKAKRTCVLQAYRGFRAPVSVKRDRLIRDLQAPDMRRWFFILRFHEYVMDIS